MTRRILTWVGVIAVLVAAAFVVRSAWQFSDDLRGELLVAPALEAGATVEVIDVGDQEVTLALTDESLVAGTWGLVTSSSYGRIGTVVDSTAGTITRPYTPVEGTLAPGSATLDQLAFRGDPLRAIGLEYELVSVEGPLGVLPAWFIDGELSTWLIYVHGAGGRAEALRVIPTMVAAGYPVLAISYRNDPGAPSSEDGLVSWGFDEWEDVEAGMEFAFAQGADEVVLMGTGLGGSAVLVALDETSHIRSIAGAILDSPILDLAAVEEVREPDSGLIGSLGRTVASWRFGVEWSRLDHVARAGDLKRPVLLLQGGRDSLVPVALGDAFAEAGGDRVEYFRFGEAGHGQAWNVAPARYGDVIADFLAKLEPAPG